METLTKKCPKCGAVEKVKTEFASVYECDTIEPIGFDLIQSPSCKEATNEMFEIEQVDRPPCEIAIQVPKPRKRKAKAPNPVQGFLDALKFVSQASAKTGTPAQTHCTIENGMLSAFNGCITIGHPIHEDLTACPHTFALLEALGKVQSEVSITQVSDLELCVSSGAFSVNVPCSPGIETPIPPPNIHNISNNVKSALEFVAPIPRDDKTDLVRSSVLLQTGSAVGTCGLVVGEYWHGENLPTMILPKALAKIVGNCDFDLVGFGYDGIQCTFWFANGAFVCCPVSEGNYVNYKPLFETDLQPAKIQKDFFKGLKGLAKSSDSKICEFSDAGILVASAPTSNVKSLYKVEGLPAGMRFISKQLLQAEKMSSVVWDDECNLARFFSDNSRMLVRALDMEPKE